MCHMRRSLILSVRCILLASLLLATSVSGFFGASHELARVGQSTLVICGQDGTSVITLDRNGTPVTPASTSCGHCADCSLISVFDLPVFTAIARQATQAQLTARADTETILTSGFARHLPRGPPNTFRS
ncbi:MAG: hypothetical protein ACJARR_003490 [Pseudophaeobacter arcticus]